MLLEIHDLKKKFGRQEVLKGIDLTIEPGQIIGLLGSNGAGKSTLMKCINGLLQPDEGTITFESKPLDASSHAHISYLPEKTYLDPGWTVKRALTFFEDFYPDFDTDHARRLLKDMHLDEFMEIKAMSKGMQEKLQLILVMSRKARLYILDEPLGGVDPASRDHILDTIITSFHPESALLISTHLISDIERVLDRALFLKDGKIFLDENAEDLRARTNHSIDQEFRKVYNA